MKKIAPAIVLAWVCVAAGLPAGASSPPPAAPYPRLESAAAAFRGKVMRVQSFRNPADGHLYTRTVLRVEEAFKGRLPTLVTVVHRGGNVDGRGEADSFAPQFQAGEERLMVVSRRADGTLYATPGGTGALKLTAGAAVYLPKRFCKHPQKPRRLPKSPKCNDLRHPRRPGKARKQEIAQNGHKAPVSKRFRTLI